jgi:hypothetical protein
MGCARRAGWATLVVAAALLGGCGGEDDPVKPLSGPTYPQRSSPQNVLTALVMSYQARDSMETKQLYDSSYVGTSQDLSDPPGTPVSTFRYDDEIRHVAALALSTTITVAVMDFGPPSSWARLASDDVSHPEWAMIQIPFFHLEINDGPTLYEALSSTPMTFVFNPTVTAPGDTLWRIVRWNEVGGIL